MNALRLAALLATALLTFAGLGPQDSRPVRDNDKAILAVLDTQVAAWNKGDIDAFMTGYLKTDALSFSSGGKTTYGWTKTRDGYKTRYPDRKTMGTLSFRERAVTPLGEDAALVLGRWHLDRESGPIGGNFSLVFRKLDGAWVIIHDHTSVDPNEAKNKPKDQ